MMLPAWILGAWMTTPKQEILHKFRGWVSSSWMHVSVAQRWKIEVIPQGEGSHGEGFWTLEISRGTEGVISFHFPYSTYCSETYFSYSSVHNIVWNFLKILIVQFQNSIVFYFSVLSVHNTFTGFSPRHHCKRRLWYKTSATKGSIKTELKHIAMSHKNKPRAVS